MKMLPSAGSICRARDCSMRGSPRPTHSRSPPSQRCRKSAHPWWRGRGSILGRRTRSCAAIRGASSAHRGSCRNIIAPFWNCLLNEGSLTRAGRFGLTRWPVWPSFFATPLSESPHSNLMKKIVHSIGAGISGLSAAVRLANANFKVHVHEATQQAGGRCRSYFDAATNLTIDNGNHLLLSGNRHALAYARSIGTEAGLGGPKLAQFPFVDVSTGQRWLLDLGDSKLPLWVLDARRRVPDTGIFDYLGLMPLIWAGKSRLVGEAIRCEGTLYQRLVQPLLLAA